MHRVLIAFLFLASSSYDSVWGIDDFALKKRSFTQGKRVIEKESWKPGSTAVIVCDMWDAHHCRNAVLRVNEMAPRLNAFLKKARSAGATIIHAPSSCVGFYENHPARKQTLDIPISGSVPEGIGQWCDHIPQEIDYPIDQSDGGEDDDPDEHRKWAETLRKKGRNPRAPWKKQTELLQIENIDFISDNGKRIWSILEHRKIENVMLVGVHTNMCVLGRPFGLRQMAKNGKNVVLVRDLTDTMYNPLRWPYVSHFQGTQLIIQHVEKYVCSTITSNQLLGGSPFRFKADQPKKCLIICGEALYGTEKTLEMFAKTVLQSRLGIETRILVAKKGENQVESLVESLESADLLILSMRRRALPAGQLTAIKKHLEMGKPMLALRTSSHAFDTRGKHPVGYAEWPEFDKQVLGCNYNGHHANDLACQISVQGEHKILLGVKPWVSHGSLYRSSPLKKDVTPLLIGSVKDHPAEPVSWIRTHGKAKVFYTSLGHVSDFQQDGFLKLLENGVRWSLSMKIGTQPSRLK